MSDFTLSYLLQTKLLLKKYEQTEFDKGEKKTN